MRGTLPTVFTSLRVDPLATPVADFLRVRLRSWRAA
jgi:hypothetical protein